MKHFLVLLLALIACTYLQAQEQLPDMSLFETYRHVEDNDTLPYRLYRSRKADTMMEALPVLIFHGMLDEVVRPSRSQQMYAALKVVGNEDAVIVTYPELGHVCWDEAFSMPGLFKWMFGKKKGLR